MSKVLIELRLDDFDGMEQAMNLLSGFINNNRVREAKERHGCESEPVIDQYPPYGEKVLSPDDVEVMSLAVEETELDSAGNPWDPDKHSANKSKLKDGTWRLRRNTGKDKPVPPPPPEDATLVSEEVTYKEMIDVLKGKGLSLKEMNELAQQVGMDSIALLITKPDLIASVLELVK